MPNIIIDPNLANRSGSASLSPKMDSPFFQKGVKNYILKSSSKLILRLLPSFNYSTNTEDQSFSSSYLPYRDGASLNVDEDGNPPWTQWFFLYPWIRFALKGKYHGWSGTVRGNAPGNCAFTDLWRFCKELAKDSQNPNYDRATMLLDKPKGGKNALVERTQNVALVNALVWDPTGSSREFETQIVVMTYTTLVDLLKKLNLRRTSKSKIVTPAWEDYLFGDPTDPATGLQISLESVQLGNNPNQHSCAFRFSKHPQNVTDEDVIRPITEAQLRSRYVIPAQSVIKMPPMYQEQVKAIIEYGCGPGGIPLEFVKAACGQFAHVGEANTALGVPAPLPPPSPVAPYSPEPPQVPTQYNANDTTPPVKYETRPSGNTFGPPAPMPYSGPAMPSPTSTGGPSFPAAGSGSRYAPDLAAPPPPPPARHGSVKTQQLPPTQPTTGSQFIQGVSLTDANEESSASIHPSLPSASGLSSIASPLTPGEQTEYDSLCASMKINPAGCNMDRFVELAKRKAASS